ncbi:hypothetical protein ACHAWO_007121 [Cyclotella atomus]|uniref:Uncharacterized protein n=1 Tax=Cyclotella atomus TaxID=382360 RepID=A0ABD3PT29_9STRA
MMRPFLHLAGSLIIAAPAALGFVASPNCPSRSARQYFITTAIPTAIPTITQLKSHVDTDVESTASSTTSSCTSYNNQNGKTIYSVSSDNGTPFYCEAHLDQIQNDKFLIRLDGRIASNSDEHLAPTASNSEEFVDEIVSVFHIMLLEYLNIEQLAYREELNGRHYNDDVMHDHYSKGISLKQIQLTDSFQENSQYTSIKRQLCEIGIIDSDSSDNQVGLNLNEYLPFLNGFIIRHRGSDQGYVAFKVQRMLCQRRVPYDFSAAETDNHTLISLQKQVIPSSTIDEVMSILGVIKSRQMLSTNPDSVDGLPSLHLNLVSDGKPLFTVETSSSSSVTPAAETNEKDDPSSSFAQLISQLTAILQPYLYNNLLPSVQTLLQSSTVDISDVFLRNYGHDNVDDDNSIQDSISDKQTQQPTRYTLSPHYDITAYATCVIALDSTASTGRNGLYTIPPSKKKTNDNGTNTGTNNAALRKFFPLNKGDGVVHTYNVLHGVDVDPELQKSRTSLIIWFGNNHNTNNNNSNSSNETDQSSSWLSQRTDDISQFVSGLVLEDDYISQEALDMYLSSAERGNVFAIAALAQLCSDGKVSDLDYYERMKRLIPTNAFHQREDATTSCKDLANALWYHAAIAGGNPVAQHGLAFSLMSEYASSEADLSKEEQEQLLLLASVLFTMAYNNHHQDSFEALNRIMMTECQRLYELGVEIPSEKFFASPVVRVLRISLDDESDDGVI